MSGLSGSGDPSSAKQGLKQECLAAYIQEVWTDMSPLSLRKRMAEQKTP